jgi:beta-galactosidase
VRADFGRLGAPYGQYLLSDVIARKAPAKLQAFLSAWALSPEQRQALAASRPAGATRVWCWAPGYIYPNRQDSAGIAEVTGFSARPVSLPSAEVTPTGVGRQMGLSTAWGPKAAVQPLFAVEARPEETWATYSDGSPAVAVRRTANGLDAFVGTPRLTPELLRALAKLTGVHLFTGPEAAVWAAEGHLSIQAHRGGPLTVDVGRTTLVRDALDGQPVGRGPRVILPFEQGEVRVLRY